MRELYEYTEHFSKDISLRLQVAREDVQRMVVSPKNSPEANEAAIAAYLNAHAAVRVYNATLNEFQAFTQKKLDGTPLATLAKDLTDCAAAIAQSIDSTDIERAVVLHNLSDVVWIVASLASALDIGLSELVETCGSKRE